MALSRISGFTTKKDTTVTSSPWSGIVIDTTAAAGSTIVLIVSTDGIATDTGDQDNSRHTSITDTQSNAWTKKKEWEVQFFGRTAIVSVWQGLISTQLTAGTDTLTFAWSGTLDDNVNKIICSEKFTGAVGGFTVAQAITEVLDVADYQNLTISGLSNIERLYVRAWASEGQNNGGTVSTDYTLFTDSFSAATLLASGVDATSMKGGGEYRILTGTGDSSDPAVSAAGGRSVSVYLALTPISNTPPVLDAIGSKSATPNVQLAFTATATDAEMGDTLTFSLVNSPPSGAAITTGGAFTWTPTHAQASGTPYTVRVQVSDGTDTDFEDVSVTVANTAPTLASISNQTFVHAVQGTVTPVGADVNTSDTLVYTIQSGSQTGMAIVSSTGVFTWTPTKAQVSATPYSVTLRVTDNGADVVLYAERTFTITATNTAPTLAAITDKTATAGIQLTVTPVGADANTGDVLAYTIQSGSQTGMSIVSSTGVFTWTPTVGQISGTPYSVTLRVTDDAAVPLYAERTFTIAVSANTAPVLATIGTKEGTVGALISFTAGVTDDSGDVDSFSINAVVDVVGAAINSSSGAFTWTPTKGGTYTIRFTVTDSAALTDYEDVVFKIEQPQASLIPTTGSPAHQGKVPSGISALSTRRR